MSKDASVPIHQVRLGTLTPGQYLLVIDAKGRAAVTEYHSPILLLEAGQNDAAVPAATPPGTIILRKAAT
jgi:hypothetical protein